MGTGAMVRFDYASPQLFPENKFRCLPDDVIGMMIDKMHPLALIRFTSCCKYLYAKKNSEIFWKRRCLLQLKPENISWRMHYIACSPLLNIAHKVSRVPVVKTSFPRRKNFGILQDGRYACLFYQAKPKNDERSLRAIDILMKEYYVFELWDLKESACVKVTHLTNESKFITSICFKYPHIYTIEPGYIVVRNLILEDIREGTSNIKIELSLEKQLIGTSLVKSFVKGNNTPCKFQDSCILYGFHPVQEPKTEELSDDDFANLDEFKNSHPASIALVPAPQEPPTTEWNVNFERVVETHFSKAKYVISDRSLLAVQTESRIFIFDKAIPKVLSELELLEGEKIFILKGHTLIVSNKNYFKVWNLVSKTFEKIVTSEMTSISNFALYGNKLFALDLKVKDFISLMEWNCMPIESSWNKKKSST